MSDWLPDEVVTGHILVRLPVRSLLRFRSVCKHWRSVIDGPEFVQRSIHNSAATARNADEIFVLTGDLNGYIYSIPNSSGVLRHQTSPEILPQFHSRESVNNDSGIASRDDVTICGSCHGLVCLSYGSTADADPIYILNPATRKHHLALAPWPDGYKTRCRDAGYSILWPQSRYGFGYDSASKDYKFVRVCGMVNESLTRCKLEVISFGIRSKTLQVVEMPYPGLVKQMIGVFLGGALHWPFRRHNAVRGNWDAIIVAYDLGTNQCREIPLPEGCEHNSNLVVVELNNCLCVFANELEKEMIHVWMMEEYGVKRSWSKLFSFSDSGSVVPLGLSMNGHEVVLLHFDGGRLVWFDIKEGRASQVMHLDGERFVSGDIVVRTLIQKWRSRVFGAIACFGTLARPDGN